MSIALLKTHAVSLLESESHDILKNDCFQQCKVFYYNVGRPWLWLGTRSLKSMRFSTRSPSPNAPLLRRPRPRPKHKPNHIDHDPYQARKGKSKSKPTPSAPPPFRPPAPACFLDHPIQVRSSTPRRRCPSPCCLCIHSSSCSSSSSRSGSSRRRPAPVGRAQLYGRVRQVRDEHPGRLQQPARALQAAQGHHGQSATVCAQGPAARPRNPAV